MCFPKLQLELLLHQLLLTYRDANSPQPTKEPDPCYIEFGENRVGRVDVDFLSGPSPTGSFFEPSVDLVSEKLHFGSSRRARWFEL